MLFVDFHFLFLFLPIALGIHHLTLGSTQNGEYRNLSRLALFGLTLVFYGSGRAWWLIPLFISIGFDFVWANLLGRTNTPRLRRLLVICSLLQNLTLLALFKYRSPILWALGAIELPGCDALAAQIAALPNEMPAGISFYTFESLSFVIDVYRRDVVPPSRPLEFFAFIGMFPRFVAGPIVRYKEMVSQFRHYRGMEIERGLCLFAFGLFLKTVFADNFAVFGRSAFDRIAAPDLLSAWLGVLAYTLQLYFDFSGYSLMAIGLGRCFGFQFPANFNRPYLASSLSDFWRRWHITLSRWLRDYLYVSLGGNRHGPARTYLNLFLTMLLGGIWHGSGLPFVIWGAWHGMGLMLERAAGRQSAGSWAQSRLTFLFVMLGWIFFRADSLAEASRIFSGLVGLHGFGTATIQGLLLENPVSAICATAGLIYCFGFERNFDANQWDSRVPVTWIHRLAATAMLIFSLKIDRIATKIPFLYFQF